MNRFLWIVGALLVIAALALGQTSGNERGLGSSLDRFLNKETPTTQLFTPIPFEEVIDETEYIVGPNDLFNFLLPGITKMPIQLYVSPEGKLIIPSGGEFYVSGKTLKSVKEEVKRSFKVVNPSITLFIPRQFVVTVLGAVDKPGTYVMSSVLRIDKAVALANAGAPAKQSPALVEFSTRRIILRRKGIPDRLVDLDRFYAFRNSTDNPFLQEGDIIIVPQRNIDQSSVSVYGAVNAPNQYEFRENDSLVAMLKVAQGLTPNADPGNVELSRLSPDASSVETQVIDISDILAGADSDIPLRNKDRILVREKVDRRRDYKVHVRGEVRLPGMYPITPDSTRLSEVIARAGGFTEFAFLSMAEVERKQLTPQGRNIDLVREALLNMRMNDQLVTPEERAYYDLEASIRRGTVAVDFVALFSENRRTNDIYLKDGDIIFIPNATKTVYVYGQVGRPGYVMYKEGADLRYYIGQAGGYGEEAEDGETRVIKNKTRSWLSPSETVIEPGDYVWVPKEIRYPTGYYLNLVSQAASFISVVLSMTVIILQLTQN